VRQKLTRFAGDCNVWIGELPEWAAVRSVGTVSGYWRWRGAAPESAAQTQAAWGYRAGFGGHGQYGLLGAKFEPHAYPFLAITVSASVETATIGKEPFHKARVGLPHEYVGAVLAGALQEPDNLGPGTLSFDWAAVHDVDSSWEVFRVLAIGVGRLLRLPTAGPVPSDLLPYFGGETPVSPGAA
jgi:hypothetical protein